MFVSIEERIAYRTPAPQGLTTSDFSISLHLAIQEPTFFTSQFHSDFQSLRESLTINLLQNPRKDAFQSLYYLFHSNEAWPNEVHELEILIP